MKLIKSILLLGALITQTAFATSRDIPADSIKFKTQAAAITAPSSGYVSNYFLTSDGFPYFRNTGGTINGYVYSASALTQYGVLLGLGTRGLSQLAPNASTAFPLVSGGASANPSWSLLTVAGGGSGLATRTDHSLQVGAGTAAVTQLAVGGTGTILAGVAGADPVWSATPSLGVAGATKGTLSFSGNTSGTILVQPLAAAGTYTITLPPDDGDADEFLKTNGSGVTTWEVPTAGSPTFVGMRAHGSTTTISGTIADIVWTTEVIDTAAAFNGTTFTAPLTGKYLVVVRMQFDQSAPTAGNVWEMQIRKGASTIVAQDNDYAFSTTEQAKSERIVEVLSLTAADTIKVSAKSGHNTPVIYDPSANASNVFSVVYLGP